eukprot:15354-Pyramimonas_sp.AAC.1
MTPQRFSGVNGLTKNSDLRQFFSVRKYYGRNMKLPEVEWLNKGVMSVVCGFVGSCKSLGRQVDRLPPLFGLRSTSHRGSRGYAGHPQGV